MVRVYDTSDERFMASFSATTRVFFRGLFRCQGQMLSDLFFPVDVEASEDGLHFLGECDIALKVHLLANGGRQLVILGGEISQGHQATRDGCIDFARWRITTKAQTPATRMTIQLKIEVGDIDGYAIALHLATALQGGLVQCEQPIAANFDSRQKRALDRVEQGSAETVGRLHYDTST